MKKDFEEKRIAKILADNLADAEKQGKEFGELWVPVYDEELFKKVKDCFEKKKQWQWVCDTIYKVEYDLQSHYKRNNYILKLYGGQNGPAPWDDYFDEMKKIFFNLKKIFKSVILIDWKNDCLDDCSVVRISVSNEN